MSKMRRNEFQMEQNEEVEAFLAEMSFGFLGTSGTDESGWPHLTPLNYVYHGGKIYFHGSRIGQKMRDLSASPKVTFSVAKEYAIIPSYYSDPYLACPATSYFKSVLLYGYAEVVTDLQEKAAALEAMMRKLQPEGGHSPIDDQDERYVPRLKGVAVVAISIESLSAKFKFGQNLRDNQREPVMEGLLSRNKELDEETVRLMKLYCPAHREPTGD